MGLIKYPVTNLIGDMLNDVDLEFYNSDSYEQYQLRLKNKPKDWFYRNNPISYKLNSNGHRCSLEVSDLPSEYILFSGCSFTAGVGLHLEDTYTYTLAQKLKMPYYNIGLPGTGWDMVCTNLMTWLSLDIQMPKYVVIQWPGFYRFYETKDHKHYSTNVPNDTTNDQVWQKVLSNEFKNKNIERRQLLLSSLKEKNIKCLEFTTDESSKEVINTIPVGRHYDQVDRARDGHPGRQTNDSWASDLFLFLNDKYEYDKSKMKPVIKNNENVIGMFKYKNGLYGNYLERKDESFSSIDSKELFKTNLEKYPEDWYYRNNPISYKRNQYGHRCDKEIEALKEPYILFTGCSITEGIGLHLEDTFPYILSKRLGMDYYNLGLCGSGWDLLSDNLKTFLSLNIPKPKYVVIQWPPFHRYYEKTNNEEYISLYRPHDVDNNPARILTDEFKLKNNNAHKEVTSMLKDMNIKYFEYYMSRSVLEYTNQFQNLQRRLDLARDYHPGRNTNKLWAYLIEKDIKKNI